MKEKLANILNKVKEFFKNVKLPKVDLTKLKATLLKIKERLKKIDVLNKLVALMRAHRLVLSLIFFCVAILALILGATLGSGEFVVQVCVLMIIEVAMAVLLHKSELWIHAILLVAQVVTAFVIDRVSLTILCVVAYIVTTITLQLAFKKNADKVEEKSEVAENKKK